MQRDLFLKVKSNGNYLYLIVIFLNDGVVAEKKHLEIKKKKVFWSLCEKEKN